MKMKRIFLPLFSSVALAGCTIFVPTPPQMASTEIGPNVQVVGTVEGEARSSYVLGFGPYGENSLKAAIQDALSKRGGDALINVSIDQATTNFFGFYTVRRTMVMGTAVKFSR
jgi:uncharacterized protein YbjQ (UPF0145 family)